MKNLFAVILTSFALIQGVFAQTEKQQTSEIDKFVLEINKNLNSYRKILNEQDSIMKSDNTNNSFTETIYKNDKEIVLVQYLEQFSNMISAYYYFKKGQLILIEIKNRDNSNSKSYYNNDKLISMCRNESILENTSEYYRPIEKSTFIALNKILKSYEHK